MPNTQAYYHGLPVKLLSSSILEFVPVESKEYSLALETNSPAGCIGIQTRQTPNDHADFTHQLNLNDLLDAAIAALPGDAYALLMLVEHDIYEDEDDDFACGRAFGGSRIAVVSTARYNPLLDQQADIARQHAWPASHCAEYVRACIDAGGSAHFGKRKARGNNQQAGSSATETPLRAAVSAHSNLPDIDSSTSTRALGGMWLGRVCRTAGHELGHCFGIDHCVYYACSMQGSASLCEDARQPPYLCPVDLAKMLIATGADAKERYRALLLFCDRRKDVHLFAAFGAWIRGRLQELNGGSDVIVID